MGGGHRGVRGRRRWRGHGRRRHERLAHLDRRHDETGTGDDAPPTSDGPMSSDGPGDAGSSGDDTGPATGSDSAGGVCEGPQANACLDCAVAACCTEWSACQADEGCACVIDCHVVRGGSLGNCESQCDHDGELYQGVFFCGQQSCLGTCEWDCC
jgi:hypothetical protein